MPNCTSDELDFGRLGRQVICADFDGSDISTEGGVMLLRQVDSKDRLDQGGCKGIVGWARPIAHHA